MDRGNPISSWLLSFKKGARHEGANDREHADVTGDGDHGVVGEAQSGCDVVGEEVGAGNRGMGGHHKGGLIGGLGLLAVEGAIGIGEHRERSLRVVAVALSWARLAEIGMGRLLPATPSTRSQRICWSG
jgi:hypothetical protein